VLAQGQRAVFGIRELPARNVYHCG